MKLVANLKGRQFGLVLPPDASLHQLAVSVVSSCDIGLDTSTLRILHPKIKCGLRPSLNPHLSLAEAGIRDGDTVTIIGSTRQEVNAVLSIQSPPGMLGIEEELARAARRTRCAEGRAVKLPSGRYTFQQFRALSQAELGPDARPGPDAALAYLHRLAADPGIVGVMTAERFTVGTLSEMLPADFVDDRRDVTCLLGLNVNRGAEIKLRLRTNDMLGFRKYEIIRETLVHELTHNVFGPHDNNFKALNSRLLRMCVRLSREASVAHRLVDYEVRSPMSENPEVSQAHQASPRVLSHECAPTMPPGEAAAKAALSRVVQSNVAVSSLVPLLPAEGLRCQSSDAAGSSEAPLLQGHRVVSSQETGQIPLERLLAPNGSRYEAGVLSEGLRVLHKIVSNLIQYPENEKFWRVRRHNATFARCVSAVPALEELLMAAGFTLDRDEVWIWKGKTKLESAKLVHDELSRALGCGLAR